MSVTVEARVKQKKDTEANWLVNPLIILDGEQAFVVDEDGLIFDYKIGDGTRVFADLPYASAITSTADSFIIL